MLTDDDMAKKLHITLYGHVADEILAAAADVDVADIDSTAPANCDECGVLMPHDAVLFASLAESSDSTLADSAFVLGLCLECYAAVRKRGLAALPGVIRANFPNQPNR